MDENKKSTTCTRRKSNCSAGNVFEATDVPIINNNTITRDCNVVIPRLDTSELTLADLLKIISKNSAENKVKDGDVKTLLDIAKEEMKENGKCGIIENISNKQLNEEKVNKLKSSLKNICFKKVAKKVRFKVPIAKYRIIKPVKKKITRKLLIKLTRCDNKIK